MDDPGEPPPGIIRPGFCWELEPARTVLAHYRASVEPIQCLHEECRAFNSLNRDQSGKGLKARARFRCKACKQYVSIKEYVSRYMNQEVLSQESVTISPTQEAETPPSDSGSDNSEEPNPPLPNNQTKPLFSFEIDPPSQEDLPGIRTHKAPKPLPSIFGLKNQKITLSKERLIPAKRPAITINNIPTRMRYVTEELLQDHLSRHLESVKTMIGKTTTTDNEPQEVNRLKKENESLKREIKILKEKMGKKPLNASDNPRSSKQLKLQTECPTTIRANQSPDQTQELQNRPTFAQVARKLAKGKPEAENFRVQEALRNLAGAKPLTSGTKAELRHGYSRIFIKGIVRQKYSDVKILFKELGFKVNRLINLEFIGQKILEVTVPGYYAASFIRKIKELEIFEILPKVDPSKPMNPESSPETAGKIKKAHENRLNKAIQTTKWENFAEYLFDLAAKSGINLGKRLFPNNPEEINLNESSDEEKIVNKRRKNRIITTPPSIDQSSQNNNDLHTDQYDNKIHTTDLSDEIIPETILIMGSSPISQIDSETERQIWDNICRSDD
ncbi:hypothetical protein BB560_004752 [Smittium megazygosporum]|uniref:Uncharacterized protein n=1 Tax=Smittium megazygosporum TaxID=133381 RepID=A0A2T9Z8C9_9FUNG|nr:hypothetical protein BB560_004752 [Smittium megazygosporum]